MIFFIQLLFLLVFGNNLYSRRYFYVNSPACLPFISPNQHGSNVPRLYPIFYPKPVGLLSPPLCPHCSPIVFLLHSTRFLSQRSTEYPQKGGAMKAVKILVVLCKSDFRERKKALVATRVGSWED